jgi:hypothetical protein
MTTTTKRPTTVQLPWDSQAVFETPDGDRFVKNVAEVVELIQAEEAKRAGRQRIQDAVAALFTVLDAWIVEHRQHLTAAWLTEHDHALLLLIVQKSETYDEPLSQALVALDERLANDPTVTPLRMDTLAIPPWGDSPQSTFLSRRLQLRRRLD